MDLVNALNIYNRTVVGEWSIGESYDSLNWLGDPLLKPTLDQLIECDVVFQNELLQKATEPVLLLSAEAQLDLIYEKGFEEWLKYKKGVKGE